MKEGFDMLNIRRKHYGRDRRVWKKWYRQRLNRGFADCDVWAMDGYLLNLIPAMLRHLAESTHTYPISMKSGDEWSAWLNETADMFQLVADNLFDCNPPEEENYIKVFNEAWERLREYFFDLWD